MGIRDGVEPLYHAAPASGALNLSTRPARSSSHARPFRCLAIDHPTSLRDFR